MSFIIQDSSGATVLTAISTTLAEATGVYYLKRCKVDSPIRKVTLDSSPSVIGSFAQDFGDALYPISGGSIMICNTTEALIRTAFYDYAALIKHQIGLTLSIPNETGGTFPNVMCTAFELLRRPLPDGRTVIPNSNKTTFRAYVAMEFVQLA